MVKKYVLRESLFTKCEGPISKILGTFGTYGEAKSRLEEKVAPGIREGKLTVKNNLEEIGEDGNSICMVSVLENEGYHNFYEYTIVTQLPEEFTGLTDGTELETVGTTYVVTREAYYDYGDTEFKVLDCADTYDTAKAIIDDEVSLLTEYGDMELKRRSESRNETYEYYDVILKSRDGSEKYIYSLAEKEIEHMPEKGKESCTEADRGLLDEINGLEGRIADINLFMGTRDLWNGLGEDEKRTYREQKMAMYQYESALARRVEKFAEQSLYVRGDGAEVLVWRPFRTKESEINKQ